MSKRDMEQHRADNPIRTWRKREKLSQRTAAAALGVSVGTLTNWEYGSMLPDSHSAKKLDEAIGRGTVAALRKWREKLSDNNAA